MEDSPYGEVLGTTLTAVAAKDNTSATVEVRGGRFERGKGRECRKTPPHAFMAGRERIRKFADKSYEGKSFLSEERKGGEMEQEKGKKLFYCCGYRENKEGGHGAYKKVPFYAAQ